MGRAIRIIAGDVAATAELNDTRTAAAIWAALPIEARGQTWGDEIYFGIGIRAEAEAAKDVVALGDLHLLRSHPDESRSGNPAGEPGDGGPARAR
jgi:hypothetical protein